MLICQDVGKCVFEKKKTLEITFCALQIFWAVYGQDFYECFSETIMQFVQL